MRKNYEKIGFLIFFLAAFGIMHCSSLSANQLPEIPITIDMRPFNPKDLPGPQPSTRERVSLNGLWDFLPIIDKALTYGPQLERLPPVPGNGEWEKFRVPAKWNCAWCDTSLSHDIPKRWQNATRAWYRRDFIVPVNMKDKRIKLHFKGVLVYTEVFVNDKSVGKHYSGVTPFSLDITDIVRFGQTNKLRMYVVNQDVHYINPPVSRYEFTVRAPIYYSYRAKNAGIWQDVSLIAEPDVIVDDAHIITSVRKKQITANITLLNSRANAIELDVVPVVEDSNGNLIKTFSRQKVKVPNSETILLKFEEDWKNPELWSPEEPNLYYVHTKIESNSIVIDEHYQRFGFREFWIDGKNFMLNGRRISLLGSWSGRVASWDDVYTRPEYMRLYLTSLKDANFIGPRMHLETPHAMDICDEIGLPVIATGISDGPAFFDPAYADEGMRHTLKDMRDWLREYRNHPSILIWSTENEDHRLKNKKNIEHYRAIDNIFTKMDPTRPFMHDGSRGFDYAPIENLHYDRNLSSLDLQIHMLNNWENSGTKPRIEGEIHPIGNEFFVAGLFRYIGDRVWGDIDYRYRQWDRIIRLLSGGWRASGSSGFMLHAASYGMFKSPIYTTLFPDNKRSMSRVLKFKWDDLSTPSPKPKYFVAAPLDFFNPWTDAAPSVIKTPMFNSIRHVFNPVLVTLARTTEHTYWSKQKAIKKVYIINESPEDLSNVRLLWSLSSADGHEVDSGNIPCSFKQGERRPIPVTLLFPHFLITTDLKFSVKLETDKGVELSHDFMDITVYPRPAKLIWTADPILLYDKVGRTENILKQLNIPFTKLNAEDLHSLPADDLLLIGASSADKDLISSESILSQFMAGGGNILIMNQLMNNALSRSVAFIRTPGHPVFRGLPSERLELWRSKKRELSSAGLRINLSLRQKALLEVVANPQDNVFSDYIPVIVESISGNGSAIISNLNLMDAFEQGDPEAVIMLRNLLLYASSPVDIKRPNVHYAGNTSELIFFRNTLHVESIQFASSSALTDGLRKRDLLIIGGGVHTDDLEKQKLSIETFVKEGGTVLCTGSWSEGSVSWVPSGLKIKKLPKKLLSPQRYSTGAFHLWKRSDNRILDGLGDLYIFKSNRARRYFIGDNIPDLEYGFIKPEPSWIIGYEIAANEKSNYKGKYRLPYYTSKGDAAFISMQHGNGQYILSTVPLNKTDLSKRLYGTLMTNLNVQASETRPFLVFSDLKEQDAF